MKDVRAANRSELDHLARLWHDGWRDAHEKIVPGELTRARTLESFSFVARIERSEMRERSSGGH